MLPYTTLGVPVAIEWMIVLPYSWLRWTSIGSSLLRERLHLLELVDVRVAAAEVLVDRHVEAVDARSWPCGMKYGLYSALCSDDSVTK